MYSKIAEEKDNEKTERCQKYTDGILIFVSPHGTSPYWFRTLIGNIEWFILCHRRCIACCLDLRPQAKLARHLRILSREHLSGSGQSKRFSTIDPIYLSHTTCILSAELCHLGKLTLVLELGSQHFKCYGGNDDSEVGS